MVFEHLIYDNNIWFNKFEADQAENSYFAQFAKKSTDSTGHQEKQSDGKQQHTVVKTESAPKKPQQAAASSSDQIRNVRQLAQPITKAAAVTPKNDKANDGMEKSGEQRLQELELAQRNVMQMIEDLKRRVAFLESNHITPPVTEAPKVDVKPAAPAADDDDDVDLFGSDDEEQSAETKERLAKYAAEKSTTAPLIAKSVILLDVKPWDDQTDIDAMETAVRSIEHDGLLWGQSKQVPVAYGIKKLQISCVVEDDKVGTDFLEETIGAFDDYVQSVDVAAFTKI